MEIFMIRDIGNNKLTAMPQKIFNEAYADKFGNYGIDTSQQGIFRGPGVLVDWLLYNRKHENSSYVEDKFYNKFHLSANVDADAKYYGVSENYSNRINLYDAQFFAELKPFVKFVGGDRGMTIPDLFDDIKLYSDYTKTISDYGIIKYDFTVKQVKNALLKDGSKFVDIKTSTDHESYAAAYKIEYNSQLNKYSYVYFDPKIGEVISENFDTKADLQRSFVEFLSNQSKQIVLEEISDLSLIDNDPKATYTKEILFNGIEFMKDTENFCLSVNKAWKDYKPDIEKLGTHADSPSSGAIFYLVDDEHHYYSLPAEDSLTDGSSSDWMHN